MHIKHAELQDLRGIEHARLPPGEAELPKRGWIVLAGRNGTGKTTLLQALGAGVLGSSSTFTMLGARPEGWLRRGGKDSWVSLLIDGDANDKRDKNDPKGPVTLKVAWPSGQMGRDTPPKGNHSFVINQFWDAASFGAKPEGWMMAGYGAVRFAAAATGEADQLSRAAPRRAALATLFRREASLYVTNQWVGQLHADSLESAAYDRFGSSVANLGDWKRAKRTHAVLVALLSDGLLSPPSAPDNAERVRLSSQGILVYRDGAPIPVSQLGMGYETLALMVSDIVRQMAGFFREGFMGGKKWKARAEGEPVVVPHSGVVLIDEAENHLHPELQQRLGTWLKAHFPNVQFIVTTHSPFICQAADPGGLFFVRDGGGVEAVSEESYRLVVAGTVNDIVLSEMFGLPAPYSPESKRVREALGAIESKLASGETLKASEEAERQRLLAKLPSDPSSEIDRVLEALRR